ncbi:MAG: protein kinase [Candidatus Sulfotelmatobacter sp.]
MIGQRLSHYRILEQIGAGGMGVVYRAHDEQLDRDVAIKVLPPRRVGDEEARSRFRKEALSLARLNHPNIATVHEFGTQDGVDFLVTEYIPGLTLDAKLARGPLAAQEVARIGTQLAAGLTAAHQQGIVHRDLKPGNLRLTPDGRLKILDFGLAQLMPHASELGNTVTLTQSEEISGTLPYMSPEQLSGVPPDARSDIWAAGAVLYEMATGKRPFEAKTQPLLINAILNQEPTRPSKVNAAVPALLEAVIQKSLSRDASRRYQSATELAADLEQQVIPTSARIPISVRRTNWVWLAPVVLLVLLAGGYFFFSRRQKAHVAPPVNRRRSVAVLGFRNLSQDPQKSWLSTALSEMLTTELGEGNELRTIPGESIAQMRANLALPDADSFSPPTLKRIRENLNSDDVVVGSYLALANGELRLDVRLQDAIAGETLASVSEKGSVAEIDDLVGRAGTELRARLGAGALSEAQSALVRASMPANAEAARLYSEGLQKLRLYDARAARDDLEKAAALDPEHAPTHSALAEAWSFLGYEAKAKAEAKRALELSGKFSREEQLLIEGRAHELLAEVPQAVESYRELYEFFPDNLDYGLSLIRAEVLAGHATDAESTLAQLRKLPASEADTARIDLEESRIASSLSDFKRQQAAAEQAVNHGRAVGATLLVAQALQREAQAWERMGQTRQTMDLLHQARDLFTAAGDRRGAAHCEDNLGDQHFDEGNYEEAKKPYEDALKVFEEIGAQRSMRGTSERIGNVYYSEGKLNEARKSYAQALAFDQQVKDPSGLSSDYGNLANTLDGLGDLKGALKMQQKALAAFNDVSDRRGAAATLGNLGSLVEEIGNLDQARKYYEQSLALAREISFERGQPYSMAGLGDTLMFGGDLTGARKEYEQALAMSQQMNDADMGAQLHGCLAAVALWEERYSDGASLAQQAAEAYQKNNSPGNAGWAQAIWSRNLLGSGDVAGAKIAAAKALALSRQSGYVSPRFEAALADAGVKARSEQKTEAVQELEAALASAHKLGYGIYEYEVRLAIGEIELPSGPAATRPKLAALEKDAEAHGLLLVAHQARELLGEKE